MTLEEYAQLTDPQLCLEITRLIHPRLTPPVPHPSWECTEAVAEVLEKMLDAESTQRYYRILGRKNVSYNWHVNPRRRMEAWVFLRYNPEAVK